MSIKSLLNELALVLDQKNKDELCKNQKICNLSTFLNNLGRDSDELNLEFLKKFKN